jgi:hypothetical protein
MDEVFARLSKAGGVLCGRLGDDGRTTCDEPLAEVLRVRDGHAMPERRLAALAGWTQDKKGIWQKTTRAEDLRRHGIAQPRHTALRRTLIEFPALARCPKCRTVQWLDADRLRVSTGVERRPARTSRWGVWE